MFYRYIKAKAYINELNKFLPVSKIDFEKKEAIIEYHEYVDNPETSLLDNLLGAGEEIHKTFKVDLEYVCFAAPERVKISGEDGFDEIYENDFVIAFVDTENNPTKNTEEPIYGLVSFDAEKRCFCVNFAPMAKIHKHTKSGESIRLGSIPLNEFTGFLQPVGNWLTDEDLREKWRAQRYIKFDTFAEVKKAHSDFFNGNFGVRFNPHLIVTRKNIEE